MTSCSVRRFHAPAAPPPDSHHVIPRAWQVYRQRQLIRDGVADPMLSPERLWDTRTVEACPNCHRRIHVALVAMMKATLSNDPLALRKAAFGGRRLNREQTIAYAGLCRFVEKSGSLRDLQAAKLYGEQ